MYRKLLALVLALSTMLTLTTPAAATGNPCNPGRSGADYTEWSSRMHVPNDGGHGHFDRIEFTFEYNELHRESMYSVMGLYAGNDDAIDVYDYDIGIELIWQVNTTDEDIRMWIEDNSGANVGWKFIEDVSPYTGVGLSKFVITGHSFLGQENVAVGVIDPNGVKTQITYASDNLPNTYDAAIGFYGNYGSQFMGAASDKLSMTNMKYSTTSQITANSLWDRTTDEDDWGTESRGAYTGSPPANGEDFWDDNCP